jgi:hypothetical protein
MARSALGTEPEGAAAGTPAAESASATTSGKPGFAGILALFTGLAYTGLGLITATSSRATPAASAPRR